MTEPTRAERIGDKVYVEVREGDSGPVIYSFVDDVTEQADTVIVDDGESSDD